MSLEIYRPSRLWAVQSLATYAVTGDVTFTFGGLQINTQAQVLNTSNNPIRGLRVRRYRRIIFSQLLMCTGQTRNVVFSRLAGRNAAAQEL
jgi:tricarballylate dehydrogenase